MSFRHREEDDSRLSPDAPIRRWFADVKPAAEFDRNGGSVAPIKVTHIREQVAELETQSQTSYPAVPTMEEMYAGQPSEAAEQALDTPEEVELATQFSDAALKTDIKRRIPSFRKFRDATANYLGEKSELLGNRRKVALGAGRVAISSTLRAPLEIIEQARDRTRLYSGNATEFLGRNQKKIYIVAGGIALLGALSGLSAEAYITHDFGLAHLSGGLNHAHDAAKHAHSDIGAGTVPQIHGAAEHADNLAHFKGVTPEHAAAPSNAVPEIHIPKNAPVHTIRHRLHYQVEQLRFYGDTVSYHAQAKLEAILGHKPSGSELKDYLNRTLKINHLSWEKAKFMSVGQHFKLPILHR